MERSLKHGKAIITGRVFDRTGTSHGPVYQAEVVLSKLDTPPAKEPAKDTEGVKEKGSPRERTVVLTYTEMARTLTREDGGFRFSENLVEGVEYHVKASAHGKTNEGNVKIEPGCEGCISLPLDLGIKITTHACSRAGEQEEVCDHAVVGRPIMANMESTIPFDHVGDIRWSTEPGAGVTELGESAAQLSFRNAGSALVKLWVTDKVSNIFDKHAQAFAEGRIGVAEPEVGIIGGKVGVALQRTTVPPTIDQALWVTIRNRTRAMSFSPFRDFIDRVMFGDEFFQDPKLERQIKELGPQLRRGEAYTRLHGVGSYQLLKTATEVFLLLECGVRIRRNDFEHNRLFNRDEESGRLGESVNIDFVRDKLKEYLGTPPQLPYITKVVGAAFPEYLSGGVCCDRVVCARLNEPPLIELIWSYWHEEGMLVQTMNAINRRFQNVRAPGDRDPLLHLELDPLRRVGSLLWGQIQDEQNVLSVQRRAYEYAHQYGLTIYGKAAATVRPADNRSKFLEAFHNLLHIASRFYKEDNDTTVIADGYPLLNGLKEVHLLLAQGAHNQFGDLPWTARAEMMAMEWILARPEIREFLQSRIMVPYTEPWMPQVDTMKTVQGWSDVTVTHFRDLGVYGEQILLSVRFGNWIDINDEDAAKNWARYWRPEVQAYLHAYRAATGVDLTNPGTVDATVPAVHLQRRLSLQQRIST